MKSLNASFLKRFCGFILITWLAAGISSLYAANTPAKPSSAEKKSVVPATSESTDLPPLNDSRAAPATPAPASPGVQPATPVEEAKETSAAAPSNITLDFKDADINTVLRVLSLKSKVNIVAGPEVQGTVTIRLESVPWEKALEVVLRTYDYVYERDGNIVRVTTKEKMSQESVVTNTYILNYTRASEIQDAVKEMLTERGRIRTAERTNTVIITDIPTNLYRIAEVIKKLDKRTPEAYIESKIVKTEIGMAESLGIAWNPAMSLTGSARPTTFPFNEMAKGDSTPDFVNQFFPVINSATTDAINPINPRSFLLPGLKQPTAGAPFTFGTLSFASFSATLSALKSKSNTKVVSNPRIVVLNNQTAKVQVGSDIPMPSFERNANTGAVEITGFTFRNVGVILNVTPHINSAEEILVELAPEVSSQNGQFNFGQFNAPVFDVTTAKTQVLIRSGETIAIGGLMTDDTQFTRQAIPGLSEIPLIGKLFRNKSQNSTGSDNKKIETLFFITVNMVDTEGQPVGDRIEQRIKKKFGSSKKEDKKASETLPSEAQVAAAASNPGVSANAVPLETKKVTAVPSTAAH